MNRPPIALVWAAALLLHGPFVPTHAEGAGEARRCLNWVLGFVGLSLASRNGADLMNTYDLTLPLDAKVLRFPGDPEPAFKTEYVPFGDKQIMMSNMDMGLHVGTHIDAPAHFIAGGNTIDAISPDHFVGEVQIIDLSHLPKSIDRADLEPFTIRPYSKLFIKTRNSAHLRDATYKKDHVFLTPDAAAYLAREKIALLGFDYYNIDSSEKETLDSHLALAAKDIPVIVAIDLSKVEAGTYGFSALPLKLTKLEASPVRVVVWRR